VIEQTASKQYLSILLLQATKVEFAVVTLLRVASHAMTARTNAGL